MSPSTKHYGAGLGGLSHYEKHILYTSTLKKTPFFYPKKVVSQSKNPLTHFKILFVVCVLIFKVWCSVVNVLFFDQSWCKALFTHLLVICVDVHLRRDTSTCHPCTVMYCVYVTSSIPTSKQSLDPHLLLILSTHFFFLQEIPFVDNCMPRDKALRMSGLGSSLFSIDFDDCCIVVPSRIKQ